MEAYLCTFLCVKDNKAVAGSMINAARDDEDASNKTKQFVAPQYPGHEVTVMTHHIPLDQLQSLAEGIESSRLAEAKAVLEQIHDAYKD
jgi:hypothetical protein